MMNFSSALDAQDTAPERVLVVDDMAQNRTLLERLLSGHGHKVRAVSTGEEALDAVDIETPDLILLDVQMPGMDGFEVCRILKNRPSSRLIPIVLITGLTDRESRMRGINAGADDFIHKPFDSAELLARVRSLVRLKRYTDELESADALLMTLALTVEARDSYTDGHCQRLSNYATMVGRELRLKGTEVDVLQRGAYLHDIGKIGIPDSILLKPGELSVTEYSVMKRHPLIGEGLCGELRSLAPVRSIVRHHHERLDGSGYPDGLIGEDVPILAQIIGIVDTYDAITTTRPYRQARSSEDAIDALKHDVNRGLLSDELVRAFVSALHAS